MMITDEMERALQEVGHAMYRDQNGHIGYVLRSEFMSRCVVDASAKDWWFPPTAFGRTGAELHAHQACLRHAKGRDSFVRSARRWVERFESMVRSPPPGMSVDLVIKWGRLMITLPPASRGAGDSAVARICESVKGEGVFRFQGFIAPGMRLGGLCLPPPWDSFLRDWEEGRFGGLVDVYAMSSDESLLVGSLVKIGKTSLKNPDDRLAAAQLGHPFPLRVHAILRDVPHSMERDIHRMLRRSRVRRNGEWFVADGVMLSMLRLWEQCPIQRTLLH